MLGHIFSSPGSVWAIVIVVALGVAALAAITWAFRAVRRAPDHRPHQALLFGAPLAFTAVALGAWVTIDEWDWLLEDGSVQSDGVSAPGVELASGTELFRIGDGSTVTYRVQERLGGSRSTAEGITDLVAGDIALDRDRPSASTIGVVVVNIEAFTSDSNLRDKRIRHDYLESTAFPYATFAPTTIDGLPDEPVAPGEQVDVTLTGELTVKETTATETFTGWVELDGDELRARVSSTVSMSDYDVGPIAISGLVSTDDEVELVFDLTARRVDPASAPAEVGVFAAPETTAATVPPTTTGDMIAPEPVVAPASFATTVQPTLERHCASCHRSGGVGAATVVIETAGDAASVAADIGLVVEAGYMPPWTAGPQSVAFEHDWSLSDEQIDDIVTWIRDGGVLDVDPDTPLTPTGDLVRELDADDRLVGEPYTGSLDQRDDYRCQAYELSDADATRWVTGYTIDPDQVEIVHHAVFFHAPATARDDARALDARDEAPGWPCFGLSGLSGANQIGAWAPGQQPKDYPAGAGLRFEPGDFVVTQIHYHYDHDTPADESAMLLEFASDDDLAAAGGALRDVRFGTYLAPAEIPCSDDESGPLCDRSTVLVELAEAFGPFAARIPDGLIAACGADLEMLMADTDGVAHATCDHRVGNPGEIVGIFGHMHEFGRTFTMTLNPGTPGERILLDIPNWSFEWQFDFRPVEPIVLERTDVLRVECTWDRSLAPMPEPRYITWNEGTADEMCYSTVSTIEP